MSRVFLMKWFHFNVEYFEDLRNIDHCEFLTMRQQPDSGKYMLENKLRTWSELRHQCALAAGDDADATRARAAAAAGRRWGGCPNGCNHSNRFNRRHDLEALRQTDYERTAAHHRRPARPDSPRQPDLHLGRDFGGSYSGHNSKAGSDSDRGSVQGPADADADARGPPPASTTWTRPSVRTAACRGASTDAAALAVRPGRPHLGFFRPSRPPYLFFYSPPPPTPSPSMGLSQPFDTFFRAS